MTNTFCGIKKLDLPNFPTSCRYALFRVAVRLHISCRRASESGRVGDAWRFTETGPRQIEKTHSILYAVSVDVIYRCRIIFLYFLLGLSLLHHEKEIQLVSWLVSLFYRGGTRRSRWLLHYAEWDSRCQCCSTCFEKHGAVFFLKHSWFTISLNFLERKNLPKNQHTWLNNVEQLSGQRNHTLGKLSLFGTTRCFFCRLWLWLQVQFQAKFCWLQAGY